MDHDHSIHGIKSRLSEGPVISYLRDWVYGGIDGAVTTFAVAAGVEGASFGNEVVLILGAANVLADGFSMAAGNFSSTRAERAEHLRLRRVEERHIQLHPDGEREEVRQLYLEKGFTGQLLEDAVQVLTSDRERWIRVMLAEEYGLASATRVPGWAAASTFGAFLVCGLIPLLPYWHSVSASPFPTSCVLTGLVFFAIGSIKSRWTAQSWWLSGSETLAIGGTAAALSYVLGWWLRAMGFGG